MPSLIGLRDQERRPPPDPDGPAGPPPAFDATPLQRERERLMARVDLLSGARDPKPVERPAPKPTPEAEAPKARPDADGPKPEVAADAPKAKTADAPKVAAPDAPAVDALELPKVAAPALPRAEEVKEAPKPRSDSDSVAAERLETEVAEVRRIAEPEPGRGLDMVM